MQPNARGLVLAAAVAIIGVAAARTLPPRLAAPHSASNDARDVFAAALAAERRGSYHEAREGYLRALSLDPKMADARYQLALLTHAARADEEARYNLEQLEAIAPNDPRLPGLRATLNRAQ